MSFIRNDPALKKKRQELRRNQTEAEKALWSRMRNRQGVLAEVEKKITPPNLPFVKGEEPTQRPISEK